MKIQIELGYSHLRDSLAMIDRALHKYPNDAEAVSLKHLRDAIAEAPEFAYIHKGITKLQAAYKRDQAKRAAKKGAK